MLQIPKKVKVGGLTYTVAIVPEMDDKNCVGRTDFNKLLIRVEKGQPDFMQLVFLHEVLHAINAEWEDERVEFLAMALQQLIHDNPKIFKNE